MCVYCVCLHPLSLDYPGIGPEHSFLKDVKRAEYYAVTDAEALEGFQLLSKCVKEREGPRGVWERGSCHRGWEGNGKLDGRL